MSVNKNNSFISSAAQILPRKPVVTSVWEASSCELDLTSLAMVLSNLAYLDRSFIPELARSGGLLKKK